MNKKRLLISILFFAFHFAFGQNPVKDLFKKADEQYENKDIDSSLITYEEIVKLFPNDPAYPRAFYNVGYVSWELKRYDEAEKVFLKILESNFDDNEKGPGSGIMSEPYALYKHRACAILSEIYLDNQDFQNALKYLKLSDKKYPYRHFCGNELAENEISTAVQYSKCYAGLNQIENAVNVLWPHIFFNGLAFNGSALEQMKIVLNKKYSKKQIYDEIIKAEKTITVRHNKNGEVASIIIFHNKINLPKDFEMRQIGTVVKFDDYQKLKHLEKSKKIYTSSDFYRAYIN